MTNEMDSMPWEESVSSTVAEDKVSYGGVYDLEERTAKFGESVIDFLKLVPLGPRTNRLVDQLTGSGTSIGANYVEADDAVSKKEFIKIIGTCHKESRETKFFLRMLVKACPELRKAAVSLWREANELHLIFSRIRRSALDNSSQAMADPFVILHSTFVIPTFSHAPLFPQMAHQRHPLPMARPHCRVTWLDL